MHLLAIGWLYVVGMMAAVAPLRDAHGDLRQPACAAQ